MCFPTHTEYANAAIIFHRVTKSNLQQLVHLFQSYKDNAGQEVSIVSITKSKSCTSGWTHSRKKVVADTLGFSENSLAFSYLGVPIFVGKHPRIHLKGLADKTKEKLHAWKGSLLSYTGRITPVSSVINNFKWTLQC